MEIKLFRPHSLEEALSQRAEYGRDALPIAGAVSRVKRPAPETGHAGCAWRRGRG